MRKNSSPYHRLPKQNVRIAIACKPRVIEVPYPMDIVLMMLITNTNSYGKFRLREYYEITSSTSSRKDSFGRSFK